MISATQASKSVSHARGVLAEIAGNRIVFEVPGSSYRLHLRVYQQPQAAIGKRLVGTIRAEARRIDLVSSGGRYIEPVFGRPRRVQGEVVEVDAGTGCVTVDAGVPVVCKVTDVRQTAASFKVGDFVSFDVLPGATFTPAGA